MRQGIRVLFTKIGLDGHDRGYRLVAKALRDAGMEVIVTGPWMSVEEVTSIAVQEDVDVIGISSLSFDHLLIPRLMDLLRKEEKDDALVLVGGTIPEEDVPALLAAGVAGVFQAGSKLTDIVVFIETHIAATRTTQRKGS